VAFLTACVRLELPREALSEWLALPQPQKDVIDEAVES
jgi:hypothetical protein